MDKKEKLYKAQKLIGEEISLIHTKLKNKTTRKSDLEIKNRLTTIWSEFQQNHTKILAVGINTDKYFDMNYFQCIESEVSKINNLLKAPEEDEQSGSVVNKQPNEEDPEKIKAAKTQPTLLPIISTIEGSLIKKFHRTNENFKRRLNEAYKEHQISSRDEKEVAAEFSALKLVYEKLTVDIGFYDDNIEDTFEESKTCVRNMHKIVEQKSANSETKNDLHKLKLEEVRIPAFNGDISEWMSFRDLFVKLVHEAEHISNVEKMFRLKSLVKGEAAKLILHLSVTDANYEAAWSMLKQRYENRRLLFTSLVDRLLDQPTTISESAASIKRLLDTTNECLFALKNINISLTDECPFIARVVIRKLDRDTLRQFEQGVKKSKEIQTLDDVLGFLDQQYQTLEAVRGKGSLNNSGQKNYQKQHNTFFTESTKCFYCQISGHRTKDCRKLLQVNVAERRSWTRKSKLCYVCLDHTIHTKCTSKTEKCQICKCKHNTILHDENFAAEKKGEHVSTMVTKEHASPAILLATAQIKVKSQTGDFVLMRALIDQGSQKTMISEEAAQILAIPRTKVRTELQGIGNTTVGISKNKVWLDLKPRFLSQNVIRAEALVLPTLAMAQPSKNFDFDFTQWKNHTLADPLFNKSDRIDVVIGGDIYGKILEDKIEKIEGVLGQSTKFGWILSGIIKSYRTSTKKLFTAVTNLEQFWELEEVSHNDPKSKTEDQLCLEVFTKNKKVDNDGRYTVTLPLKEDKELGDSKKQAIARFLNLEKKLEADKILKEEYSVFMKEYLELGHMEEVKESNKGKYYLPHQAIIRANSLTTKLRVVFDASAKTTNGRSLNDIMMVGPKLQKDIFDIILKWRLWKYALTADIEKMYRQIKIAKDDREYQHILWRDNKNSALKEYQLTTVTYGMAAAPFLAVKTLIDIANNCSRTHDDDISKIIREDFYMDDLMTGADSLDRCMEIQQNVSKELKKHGFHLRKWLENDKKITSSIPNCGNNELIEIKYNEAVKTLGLNWDPTRDEFKFYLNLPTEGKISKRTSLSNLARIFDPLGWLSPVTVVAKLFMQKLWIQEISWDSELEDNLKNEWNSFIDPISTLNEFKIPRWLQTSIGTNIELHGFADASEKAYAAVVYMKMGSSTTLISGKSKVNPIKNRKTLPKLELCAAQLLAKLLHRIITVINRDYEIYAWSDSTITLCWIRNNKSKDKFVRTRVNEINILIPKAKWGHVISKQNPADVASRGIYANQLSEHKLWWNGPEWLKEPRENWPKQYEDNHQPIQSMLAVGKPNNHFLDDLITRYSSFSKLQRIVAFLIRFIRKKMRISAFLNYSPVDELELAWKLIVKHHQESEFGTEIKLLHQHKYINPNNKILDLDPFLDKYSILRVGGRLHHSNLQYNQRHPVILNKSSLTTAIIEDTHRATLHGGIRVMETTIRRRYWIIGLRNAVKKCIRLCPRCIRYRQGTAGQIMGNLPEYRVTVSHPFEHTGIDYAGPVLMRCSKGRGQKSFKGYISVFVCMSTKAIHLEAVSDMTTEAFMTALRRFFGRRGKSAHLYSDNGSNFVGASRQMDKDFQQAIKRNTEISQLLATERIQWHFIPPAAPHFGGIWEAGVKAVKHHLKRVVGDSKLTFEEMATLLAQIEGVLNSRPLCALNSNNVDDIDVLTPGHFLIGRPLIDCPESVNDLTISSTDKWKLIQKMKRDFWNRWKNEYLHTLQQRKKWNIPQTNVKENDVVIIKDENTPPSRWPLGKITEVHTGNDGKVRVVTLKVKNGTLKRPVHKILVCPQESTR